MAIVVTRVTARILLALLFPLWLALKVFWYLMGYRKPIYVSTIDGDPLRFAGDKPLVIALWHEGLSFWDDTAAAVEQLRAEFAGRCEFAYVEVTSRAVAEAYNSPVVPALILRHRGAEVGRFVNVMSADEVRPAVMTLAGATGGGSLDAEPGAAADGGA